MGKGESTRIRRIGLEKSSGVCGYLGAQGAVYVRGCVRFPVGKTPEASGLLKSLCSQNREKDSRCL